MDYIILGGKTFSKKVPKQILEKYWEEFKLNFEKDLFDYIQSHYGNQALFILKHLYFQEIINLKTFLDYIKSDIDPNRIKIWDSNKRKFKYTIEDQNFHKGHLRGKKRPEHSEKMKKIMKVVANNRSVKHKENLKKFHKERFKKTFLMNRGIIKETDNYTQVELSKLYGKYLSKRNSSRLHKIKKIKRFIENKKYEDYDIYQSFLEDYELEEITEENCESIYSEMVSIISTISSMDPNNNMGSTKFFKREWKENLKYNMQKITKLKVRSSYESKTIDFFEKNKILWDYEPFILKTNEKRYYRPDFLLKYNGKKIILELKGYIRNNAHKEKIKDQINSLIEQKGNEYVILFKRAPINSFKDLEETEFNDF